MQVQIVLNSSFSSMNYFFLNHVQRVDGVFGNEFIELELHSQFCSMHESHVLTSEQSRERLKSIIIADLVDYASIISPDLIQERVYASVCMILGYECGTISDFYTEIFDELISMHSLAV